MKNRYKSFISYLLFLFKEFTFLGKMPAIKILYQQIICNDKSLIMRDTCKLHLPQCCSTEYIYTCTILKTIHAMWNEYGFHVRVFQWEQIYTWKS
jgi:hypothetical protein